MIFDLDKKKMFSSFFAFKQTKGHILLQVQILKMLKNFCCTHFRETVKIFRGPALSQKATFQSEILELGSYCITIWHNIKCVQFFSSKITPLHPSHLFPAEQNV